MAIDIIVRDKLFLADCALIEQRIAIEREAISARAHRRGYTDLRFNPETMGWAYHKPDQAVGADRRRYVLAPKP